MREDTRPSLAFPYCRRWKAGWGLGRRLPSLPSSFDLTETLSLPSSPLLSPPFTCLRVPPHEIELSSGSSSSSDDSSSDSSSSSSSSSEDEDGENEENEGETILPALEKV